jgi:hypothetical protein
LIGNEYSTPFAMGISFWTFPNPKGFTIAINVRESIDDTECNKGY